MIRIGLTGVFSVLTWMATTDLNYHPVSKIGLISAVILLMYTPVISKFFFDKSDEEARARRHQITRKDPLKIEDCDDKLLQGYNFLWED